LLVLPFTKMRQWKDRERQMDKNLNELKK